MAFESRESTVAIIAISCALDIAAVQQTLQGRCRPVEPSRAAGASMEHRLQALPDADDLSQLLLPRARLAVVARTVCTPSSVARNQCTRFVRVG